MKDTMNKRDVASYHKMLTAETSLKEISGILGVSVETLKKFTPEAVKAAKGRQKAKVEEVKKTNAKVAQVAEVAAKAAVKATTEKA